MAGQQFDYAYDDIGNRKTTASGGDQFGNNQRTESYTPTILNQYTNRSVAGYFQVMGSANSSATVTVNNTPTSRKGDYWRAELPVNNTTGAVWLQVTNTAVLNTGGDVPGLEGEFAEAGKRYLLSFRPETVKLNPEMTSAQSCFMHYETRELK